MLLDTQVSYRFTIDGYPLVGPGAQIQTSFGAEGNVTRLVHATRTLEPGPSVAIIDADTMRHGLACSLQARTADQHQAGPTDRGRGPRLARGPRRSLSRYG